MSTTPTEGRTASEMLIKTFVIHLAAVCIFGHLNTLLHIPRRNGLHVISLVGFLLFPLLPLVQLVSNTILIACAGRAPRSTRYIVGCVLGVHARYDNRRNDPDSWQLWTVRRELTREEMKFGWTWWGRLVVPVAGLVQAVLTLLLGRRVFVVSLLPLEWRNGVVAVGGGVSAVMTVGVLVLNTEWAIELLAEDPVRRKVQGRVVGMVGCVVVAACLEVGALAAVFWRESQPYGGEWYVVEFPLGVLVAWSLVTGGGVVFLAVTRLVHWKRGRVDYVRTMAFFLLLGVIIVMFLMGLWVVMAEPILFYVKSSRIELARQDAEWRWDEALSKKLWVF